jgi:pyocin large subunit-like protein
VRSERVRRGQGLGLALLLGVAVALGGAMSRADGAAAPATVAHPEVGFASRSRLVEHYRKHGREFGAISMDEYLRQAQTLRDRPAGGDVLELVRADHTTCRFDRRSGAFLAFDADDVIRTFFRPRQGEFYFRRQAQRRAQ